MTIIGGHEHDGTRRFEISYRSKHGKVGFYSDAVTEEGAWAHFNRNVVPENTPVLRKIGPDEWLDKR